ncbi:MAG: hypothetical protein E1N59_2902 [Puniceicoccaceae bacterium 5H]|nr:MAG: hypothetical protein E1N59_2902 [Puniceicoccaceae bacterium 5H]
MNVNFDAPEYNRQLTLPDGKVLGYLEMGPTDGQPILYMHGWPSCRLQILHARTEAHRRGLRIIAPDRPGLGLSSPQPARTILDFPPLVEALADHLGLERFSVLCESGGCPYALATAYMLPHRVDRVAVLCGAPPLSEFPDWSDLFPVFRLLLTIRRKAPQWQLRILQLATWYCQLMPEKWLVKAVLPVLPRRDRDAMREPNALPVYAAMAQGTYGNGPAPVLQDGELFLQNWGFPYTALRQPVRFWHGANDKTLPPAKTRWLAEQIPGAGYELVKNEGHYSLPIYSIARAFDWISTNGHTPEAQNAQLLSETS